MRKEIIKTKVLKWIAWKMPRELVMWCAFRIETHATQGKYSSQEVPALTFMDAIERWEVEK